MTWEENENKLEKEFTFSGFNDAVEFVKRVAEKANEMDHHPDILVHDYKHVRVTTTTHGAGSTVTERDVKLGAAIDEAYDEMR